MYMQAFRQPKELENQKKLAKILKKPLDPEVEKEFFTYEAFLRGLGRMSLSKYSPFHPSLNEEHACLT